MHRQTQKNIFIYKLLPLIYSITISFRNLLEKQTIKIIKFIYNQTCRVRFSAFNNEAHLTKCMPLRATKTILFKAFLNYF